MGPTASGKTALAISLAEALNGELISVDSALVYRGLNIGSAKPDYPHHLIDICDPAEIYSAAAFMRDARTAIEAIEARGRRPILVGGTMLYYRALLMGMASMPAADPELRSSLEARALAEGWPALHRELQALDPVAAAQIHPNHSQRLLRALEVCLLSGRPLSDVHGEDADRLDRPTLCVAVAPEDRAVLHARIEERFKLMLEQGFLDEVRVLHERGDLNPNLPSMRSVGYRQFWEHLEGDCDLDTAIQRGLAATRQLAKRQFTWLRKWPELHWMLTTADGRVAALEGPWGPELREKMGDSPDPADLLLRYLSLDPM
jgi:tRNA dimethylallyltransferase